MSAIQGCQDKGTPYEYKGKSPNNLESLVEHFVDAFKSNEKHSNFVEKCHQVAKKLIYGSASSSYVSEAAGEICKLAEKGGKNNEEVETLKGVAELCNEVQKTQSWARKVTEGRPKNDREEESDPRIQAILKNISEESDKKKRVKNRFELLRKAAEAADVEADS